jgi:manganese/zinc/iron transport system permease protein
MPAPYPFIPAFDFHEHIVARWVVPGGQWVDSPAEATLWTVVMGALVAVACGWIGCYLILQGMALIGDAISHTVLLGLVVTVLVTGQVAGPAIFIGAAVTGVLTVVLIEALHGGSRLREDAATGIVFTSLFALGIVILSVFASRAHIDTQHVLYGNLELIPFGDRVVLAGISMPSSVAQMALVVIGLLVLLVLFYKELLVVSFDSQLADAIGLHSRWVEYALMAVLSITVVGAFNAVGAILVVAMLIAPAATAYLLTDRLHVMLGLSSLIGMLTSLIGYHLAYWLAVSAAGAMSCTACGLFTLSFLFSPRQGVVALAARRLSLRRRTLAENTVRQMLKLGANEPTSAVTPVQIAQAINVSPIRIRSALFALQRRGWIERSSAARVSLTRLGLHRARQLDRAHRLWETYLVDQIGLAGDHVHASAEEVEHLISDQLVERLDDVLGHPEVDPHGQPIPRVALEEHPRQPTSLSTLRVGERGRIVGIADRPHDASIATSTVAELGLTLGQQFTIVHRDLSAARWTIQLAEGGTRELTHELADLITVQADRPE